MKEIQIRVGAGKLRYIYNDDLSSLNNLGEVNIRRASHVEPKGSEWFADLSPVDGPILGPFALREKALQAEIDWLYSNKIPIPKNII
jgi:hypothetical protein